VDFLQKKIAKRLGITRKTVYRHIERIKKILKVNKSIEILPAINNFQFFDNELKFTPRGKEVFLLMIRGKTVNEIAILLNMSKSGVRRHQEKMLLQNSCASILELISKYYNYQSKI